MGDLFGDLVDTEMESGISLFTGEPFVALRSSGTLPTGETVTLRGQLSPDELRAHALRMLEVAEAAMSDHAVLGFLKADLELPEEAALAMVAGLRAHRRDMQS